VSAPPADRNLIFGLLALQMDFVNREQLLDAMAAWMLDKHTPLGDVLCRRGALAEEDGAALDRLVERHVRRHGGDAQASLAALRVEPAVRDELQRLDDADVQASLASLAPAATPRTATEDSLASPATTAPVAAAPASTRYRRLREHARGGLGEVFVARDEELRREVALKEIQERFADRADARARFLREAEVTGSLEHPGVVPVYGLGAYPDGRPFYAMRLIKGESMQEAIARFHKGDDSPRRDPSERSLALRDLLGRFVAVCNAVAYAHSRGVIHRDLKPANVMLGEYGETLVVDWGLARLLGQAEGEQTTAERPVQVGSGSAATEMGQVVGTPAFMPPEQAHGRLDQVGPGSDVFSLGATLYALLTGQAPYGGTDVLRQAAMANVVPARQRKRWVPAALEAICSKALAAKPEERYPTAKALAQEVQRWLADEPVSAYPEPWMARAGRWLRRHKTLASTTAAALLLVLVLGGFGVWRLEQQAARQRQGVEAALAEVARLQQQARWAEARVALDGAESRLGEGGAEYLRARLEQARRDLDLVARVDAIRLKKATCVVDRFDTAGADRSYEEAFRAAGMVEVGGDAATAAAWVVDSAIRKALVAALDDWAVCAKERERRDWLLQVARRADPDPWLDRVRRPAVWNDRTALARLVQEKAMTEPSAQLLVALGERLMALGGNAERLLRAAQQRHPGDFWVNFTLGNALHEGKKPAEAVGYFRAALAVRPGTFSVYNNLGVALDDQGKQDEAIANYRKAIELDPKLALAHTNLGSALQDKGEVEEAIANYRKAIAIDPKFAKAHYSLGAALAMKGEVEEAIACLRKAIALDPKIAGAHYNLGNALKAKGQLEESIASYCKAIQLDPKLALAHSNLGNALKAQGKLEEAIAAYRKAIALDPKLANAHYNLGNALYRKDEVDEAIACYQQAIELNPRNAHAHVNLGAILCDVKRDYDGAIGCFRKAIDLDPKDASAHNNLGQALYGKGQIDKAIASFRKAIALDPNYAHAHANLGNALQAKGRLAEAIECYRKALALDPKDALAYINLGHALSSQGRFAEALASLQRGHELGTKRRGWPYPSAAWVRKAKRMAALEGKLPAFLKGEFKPTDATERLALASVCAAKKLHHTATRLYTEAFAADPKRADDLNAGHRYNAACAAALAGCGQGKDAPKPDDKDRARLRLLALGWLRADLALWSNQAQKATSAARAAVQKTLQHWQKDANLAGVRDGAALEKLPEGERGEWNKLWSDVAALRKKCAESSKKQG
jgi:serine/threonine-protein kinase